MSLLYKRGDELTKSLCLSSSQLTLISPLSLSLYIYIYISIYSYLQSNIYDLSVFYDFQKKKKLYCEKRREKIDGREKVRWKSMYWWFELFMVQE
jgi:hypothetical protein